RIESRNKFRMWVSNNGAVVIVNDTVAVDIVPDHVATLEWRPGSRTSSVLTFCSIWRIVDVVLVGCIHPQCTVCREYTSWFAYPAQCKVAYQNIVSFGQSGYCVPVL